MEERLLEVRKALTGEKPYSKELTVTLLKELYRFLDSEHVQKMNCFSAYDEGCVLSAIEHLERGTENHDNA